MAKRLLYLLSYRGDQMSFPLAIYDSKQAAASEAARLEAEHASTYPAWDEWCNKRGRIIFTWLDAGRQMKTIGLPTDEQEVEIVAMIGPCPELRGHADCEVDEVEYKSRLTAVLS